VLPPIYHVGAGGGVAARRELILPKQFAGRLVESVELLVLCAADEDEAAGGDYRAAKILRPGRRQTARLQLRILTEDDLPGELALIQVDGRQIAPGWFDRRIGVLVQEAKVAGMVVSLLRLRHRGDVRDVVGVDVEEAGGRIEGGAGPGRAAVET